MFQGKNKWYKAFLLWLPLGLVTLILCGLVNLAVQQNYRMSANDPQIQAAEDVAAAISQGKATPVPSIAELKVILTKSALIF